MLSFEENGYTYLGGAHGTGYSFGCNYDTRTGEELQIQDVVTDMDTFAGLAEAAVYEESGLTMDDLFLEEGESLKDYIAKAAAEHTLNWKITNDGVSVWFNPYEISYYAAGMPSGSVKFAEQTDIFPITMRKPHGPMSMRQIIWVLQVWILMGTAGQMNSGYGHPWTSMEPMKP